MTVASNSIVTYDEVMLYAESNGFVSKDEDNTLIENIINWKSQEFNSYCGIDQLKSRQYTERVDGNGTGKLFPKRTPIISVSSIYDDIEWAFTSDSLVDSGDYVIHPNKQYIQMKYSYYFTLGVQNVKITYTAGYETIPNDIKLACIREILREFNRRQDFDVTAKTLNDGSISYVEKGLLTSTKDVLDKYRSIGIA